MTNKHIAGSGASKGQWVTCPAKQQCTLTSAQHHTTAAELTQVQQYVQDKTGERIGCYLLPLESVLEYKILSETRKNEIASNVEERLQKARDKRAAKQNVSSEIESMFEEKQEVIIPATIDPGALNSKSYLEYGFTPSEKKDEYYHADRMTDSQSIAESKRDLMLTSNIERKALVYFSTDNYDWINEALYTEKKLPSVKGSHANFGDGTVNSEIVSVGEGESFTQDPYVTPKNERTQEFLSETVNTLDNAMAKAPRHNPRVLFRGVQEAALLDNGIPVKQWVSQKAKIGSELTFNGYQSTTSSFEVASDTYASDNGSIIFEIHTPEGLNISSISSYADEQEVLLPRKSRYIVVGKRDVTRRRGRKATIVQLVAVNDSNEVLNGRNHTFPTPFESKKKTWLSSLFGK